MVNCQSTLLVSKKKICRKIILKSQYKTFETTNTYQENKSSKKNVSITEIKRENGDMNMIVGIYMM